MNTGDSDEFIKFKKMVEHHQKWSWYYYVKDRIHIKYLRTKRWIKNQWS